MLKESEKEGRITKGANEGNKAELSGGRNYSATFTCDWTLPTAISSRRRQPLGVDMRLLDLIGGDCSKLWPAPVRCRFFVFSRAVLGGNANGCTIFQNTKFRVESTQEELYTGSVQFLSIDYW